MVRVVGCITAQHDLRLVLLAACISVLACNTTVNLLARAQMVSARKSWPWLCVAAVLFGSGVWALHFVAMLAFIPAVGVGYRATATGASLAIVVAGAALGFVTWRHARHALVGRIGGGVLTGLAIGAMHFSGVAAMQVSNLTSYDTATAAASVLVGLVCVTLAFLRTGAMASSIRRIEISAWLTLGICGLHFMAMSALTLVVGVELFDNVSILGSQLLAVGVGSVALAILVISMAATLLEQHLSARTVLELARIKALSDTAREALVVCRDGSILQVNAACSRMFGRPAEAMVGQPTLELFAIQDRPTVAHMTGGDAGVHRVQEVQAASAAGALIPIELSRGRIVYDGRPADVLAMLDRSERKRDEQRIRHLALHDPLTGLANRLLLRDRFNHHLATATRSGIHVALLYLDLDRFKPVNDALGHAAGDELLVQVARRVLGVVRAIDTLARIGGDEFVILANVEQPREASVIATSVMDAIAEPYTIHHSAVEIGVTVGIAIHPDDGADPDALMRAADMALYRAKHEKRGTFRYFESAMDEQLRARLRLETELRRALEQDQIVMHYQPLISCATGGLIGFEGLVRWHHPEQGMIPPSQFIPIAEESGMIVQLGHWVMETACRLAAGWSKPWRIAVNVSPVQFRQLSFLDEVGKILAHTGLAPERLEIEVTEGVLMEATETTREILVGLRALGVRLVLDDFGTGYSSLSYLHSYQFDKLKIDRTFILRLGDHRDGLTIVRTIIGLAHNLGLEAVAEGVETPRQFGILRDYLCDQVQGYLVGRPIPMGEPTELIIERGRSLLANLGRTSAEAQRRVS